MTNNHVSFKFHNKFHDELKKYDTNKNMSFSYENYSVLKSHIFKTKNSVFAIKSQFIEGENDDGLILSEIITEDIYIVREKITTSNLSSIISDLMIVLTAFIDSEFEHHKSSITISALEDIDYNARANLETITDSVKEKYDIPISIDGFNDFSFLENAENTMSYQKAND